MYKLLLAVIAALASSAMCYDEKYDKIDVDKIINDDTLFTAYINCMLDKGPCSVEHSEDFRQLLPEVIATACAKCNELQKKNFRKSVKALSEKRPEQFEEFRKKYDPKGEYEKGFLDFLSATD